ncbi:MAG: restriction endonuclease [Stellaceae bacterium]
MEKPHPPVPESFGLTAEEIARAPDFFTASSFAVVVAWVPALVVCEIVLALIARDYDWPLLPLLVGGFFILSLPAAPLAHLICHIIDRAMQAFSPKYHNVTRFRIAQKEFERLIAEYELELRRRQEEYWKTLDGKSFERELGRLFLQMGFSVQATPVTADGGVDLILERAGERVVVQCKAHASKVAIGTARELVASMGDFKAQKGIIAAISGVTKPVADYARTRNILVYDLGVILKLQSAVAELDVKARGPDDIDGLIAFEEARLQWEHVRNSVIAPPGVDRRPDDDPARRWP